MLEFFYFRFGTTCLVNSGAGLDGGPNYQKQSWPGLEGLDGVNNCHSTLWRPDTCN